MNLQYPQGRVGSAIPFSSVAGNDFSIGRDGWVNPMTALAQFVEWDEAGRPCQARWRSLAGLPPPRRVVLADDRTPADAAFRLASEGTALLWQGDFHNARQLLQAMARRIDRRARKSDPNAAIAPEDFHRYRLGQAQRARTLGMLLLPFDAEYRIPLRRAPEASAACIEGYGPAGESFVASLRELQGLIGAHEWRTKGVPVPALGARIHPHYGVFAPVRGEYVDLVAKAPLPSPSSTAFDIGAGTGVLAAVLARRGVDRVLATDCDARALACASDNVARLGLLGRIEIVDADLFPPGAADLVVCNPPWLPGRAATPLERAVYDPESRMLLGFIAGLRAHLSPGGEGWLILSDLAEHLGLRSRESLVAAFDAAGLRVAGRIDAKPLHARAADPEDPLYAARSRETTSLWRLRA